MSELDLRQRYGPVAIVTGASSGIGAAFAHALAARGFDLLLAARRLDRLDETARSLAADYGVTVTTQAVDLARPDAAEVIVAAARGLDVGLLVSNAGFAIKGDHADNPADAMTEMLMVNCNAPLQLTRAFIPQLRARGKGGIVLTSSIEALIGCPYSAAYSASKALVKSLGEALWAELRPDGIDVLTLCPGATESEAAARSGIDPTTIRHEMKAQDVVALTLDNLRNGPTFISSDHYRAMFDQLTAMPRRDALAAMAIGMKPKPAAASET